jgi:hypothetical protein
MAAKAPKVVIRFTNPGRPKHIENTNVVRSQAMPPSSGPGTSGKGGKGGGAGGSHPS